MKHHLNTLFVTTPGTYLRKDGEAVVVSIERETKLRVPLHMLGGICCFGRVGMSPALMGRCAEAGVAITFLTEHGRLLARVQGFTSGNVLLRREQYRRADDLVRVLASDGSSGSGHPNGSARSDGQLEGCASIVQPIVTAKLLNSRTVLLRALRDRPDAPGRTDLEWASTQLAGSIRQATVTTAVDRLRGIEGEAAAVYFAAFQHLITKPGWTFEGRNRRPPRDPVNALLSFFYTLLTHDARSAAEAAGLDSQVGFLHRDRPGRPSLALDLIEELRAFLCDRLALSLVNRGQISPEGFTRTPAGGVTMGDPTRRVVLAAYQKRKQEAIEHPFLGEKTTAGLIIHLQARLLARHLRGDIDAYPPFIWK